MNCELISVAAFNFLLMHPLEDNAIISHIVSHQQEDNE